MGSVPPHGIHGVFTQPGSKARITAPQHCCPLSPNEQTRRKGFNATLCAKSCLMHRSKRHYHSKTWSARARSDGGTVRPSASAVIKFTTRSNLVGCSTGRSAGFAPRKILSA
jgi:hypothetical protein